MKKLLGLIAAVFVLTPGILAQPELPDPGMTPDHPLYGFDRFFDRFQSAEAVADERASEIKAMAEKNNSQAMEVAVEGYEQAMENRERNMNRSAGESEEVARQASNHIAVLAEVRGRVPEQAQRGISRAINRSTKGRDEALDSLGRRDPERAENVANNTLQEILANAPEEARFGLERAIQASRRRGPGGPANPEVPDEETTNGSGEEVPENTSGNGPGNPL